MGMLVSISAIEQQQLEPSRLVFDDQAVLAPLRLPLPAELISVETIHVLIAVGSLALGDEQQHRGHAPRPKDAGVNCRIFRRKNPFQVISGVDAADNQKL